MSKPLSQEGKDLIRRIVQRNIMAGTAVSSKPAISSLFKRLSDVRTLSAEEQLILDQIRKKQYGGGTVRDHEKIIEHSAKIPSGFANLIRPAGMSVH